MISTVVLASGAGLAGLTALGLGAGVLMARKILSPSSRPALVPVHAFSDSTITLPSTELTLAPGEFGLWLEDKTVHVRVGDVLYRDDETGHVTRRASFSPRRPRAGIEVGEWTGHIFSGPDEISRCTLATHVQTALGPAPAWVIPGGAQASTWVIHIHGQSTTRITALRSVPAAQDNGMTSLVPSFRNDGEGPDDGTPSTFGATEWPDVNAAMHYAVDHGATRIILVGWSMGAQLALSAAHYSSLRSRIAGLVFIAPVTNVQAVVRARARQARIPRLVPELALTVLKTPLLCRSAGIREPLPLHAMDWSRTGAISVPTLVIHSPADTRVPIASTRDFARNHSSLVELDEPDASGHAWEMNANFADLSLRISSFLASLNKYA